MWWSILIGVIGWLLGFFTAALFANSKIHDLEERMHFMSRREEP